MTIAGKDIEIIQDNASLVDFARSAQGQPFIALDTEFMRETTYWPKLCLIQAAFADCAVLIDPLAEGLDLKPLLGIMADQQIVKVFHAARQDLEIFVRLMGAMPNNVFDTQVAAMAAGYGDSVSYENLVGAILKEPVDKSSRFTDWSRRPLSDAQLRYALADVVHLRAIYPRLLQTLEDNGRSNWAQEELKSLLSPDLYDMSPERAWQRLKIRRFKTDYLAVLKSVAAWREAEAQTRDQPRQRILKDEALYEIAERKPREAEDFLELRAVPKGFGQSRLAPGLLQAIRDALQDPQSHAPDIARPDAAPANIGPTVELLKVLLRLCADKHGVAPRLIASSEDVDKLAADDAADIPALTGWRYEAFGQLALRLKHGEIALALSNKQIRMLPVARAQSASSDVGATHRPESASTN